MIDDGSHGSEVLRTLMRNTVFPYTGDTAFITVDPAAPQDAAAAPDSPRHNGRVASFEAPASPMSVASTVPAEYDPMMARQEL